MENTNVSAKTTGPKDIFLELWVMGSLYLSASFVIALLFQYINYFFVDPANPYSFSIETVRWMVAILVAVLPTHAFALRLREKDYLANPEKREHKFRKLLVYLTLFAAVIACVVDLATLVYYFLNGELSIRFLLKVLSVAIVAGGIFWYYLADLKRDAFQLPQIAKIARWTAIIVATIIIIGAFFISGSPFRANMEKLDARRINDLNSIQSQIVYYWQKKGTIPASLNELTDSISGYSAPTDPETGMAYEYKDIGNLSFELCATFSAVSPKDQANRYPSEIGPIGKENLSWQHEAGRICFTRNIDPALYAPNSQTSVKPGLVQ
ncbi:MAG: DUF5671 domain-containing protein [Candidatus Portnoybacteria bacterium]|nr:DUF5671 domain-containing protein [Candidatus Portnoybacteria bacterium]MDD4982768.1 DUF5671 domain-containing protein [Candidatus Portnoybacteria bacterium]